MDVALQHRQFSFVRLQAIWIGLSLISLMQAGCSLGRNHPDIQNALEMARIERDAAEDHYYELKHQHDEALWKIEDLETQLKGIQEDSGNATSASHLMPERGAHTFEHEPLEVIDDLDGSSASSPNEFPSRNESPRNKVSLVTAETESVQSEVSYIDIDPQLTRGFDSHGKSGDDGIVVAIKPMDSNEKFVAIAAPLTVSLIDPSQQGIRQRVGLWKFTAKQVANRIDHQASAFVFRLPWQRNAPQSSQLKLFVRYQANDGKRETNMDLFVGLDGAPRVQGARPQSSGTSASTSQTPPSKWTEVSQPGKNIDLSPQSVIVDSGSINGASLDTNRPNSTTGLSGTTTQGTSSTRVARPEWSPYR